MTFRRGHATVSFRNETKYVRLGQRQGTPSRIRKTNPNGPGLGETVGREYQPSKFERIHRFTCIHKFERIHRFTLYTYIYKFLHRREVHFHSLTDSHIIFLYFHRVSMLMASIRIKLITELHRSICTGISLKGFDLNPSEFAELRADSKPGEMRRSDADMYHFNGIQIKVTPHGT
jgi:hypothetical protein